MIYSYSDGGARGNPGPAAIGIILLDKNKKIIKKHKEYIGKKTNNQAEYRAIIKALDLAKSYDKEITCFLDSQLVVKQLNHKYKIRNPKLMELYQILKQKQRLFKKTIFKHVRRTNPYLQKADLLVNQALDERK